MVKRPLLMQGPFFISAHISIRRPLTNSLIDGCGYRTGRGVLRSNIVCLQLVLLSASISTARRLALFLTMLSDAGYPRCLWRANWDGAPGYLLARGL